MRIAVGTLMQETNTFNPTPTGLDAFRAGYYWEGDELLAGYRDANLEVAGFLQVLEQAGAEVVPLLATQAYAGGPVTRAAFDHCVGQLVERLRRSGELDGILLSLHGAMVVEDAGDAEGELLATLRAEFGPRLPIAASLDLHGHITSRMCRLATILVGYQTYPHIDQVETGQRTARLLLDTIGGRIRPVLALAKLPLLLSPVAAYTTGGPLAAAATAARAMEQTGRVLAASLFPVQPWLDVPDLGFAALVVGEDEQAATAAANELAAMVWRARDDFEPDVVSLAEAVRIGLSSAGVTVVGDAGDAPSSGSPADSSAVLSELLAQGADRSGRCCFLALRDAQAVAQCAAAGVGATVELELGHSITTAMGRPVRVRGEVQSLGDGHYRLDGPGMTGSVMHMGPTAVLAVGDLRIVLKSLPSLEWDSAVYTSVGLEMSDARLIFVKSPAHFRVSYASLAQRIVTADSPGAARITMRGLAFEHVTRPLYPLDPIRE